MSFAELVFDSRELRAKKERITKAYLKAAYDAVRETTRDLEKELERVSASAGLGRLSRAWASEVYPKNGRAKEPAGQVYPKGTFRTKGAMRAYGGGARITGKSGNFLAIPLPAAGQKSFGRSRVPLTPGEWERRTGLKLRFVYRPGKPSLLVLDEGVLSGKRQVAKINTAKRRAKGRGNTTIPIFVLVPQVDIKQRFSIERIKAPYPGRLKRSFELHVAFASKGH